MWKHAAYLFGIFLLEWWSCSLWSAKNQWMIWRLRLPGPVMWVASDLTTWGSMCWLTPWILSMFGMPGRDPKRTRPEAKCRFLVNFVNGLDNSSSIPRYSPPLAGAFIVNWQYAQEQCFVFSVCSVWDRTWSKESSSPPRVSMQWIMLWNRGS